MAGNFVSTLVDETDLVRVMIGSFARCRGRTYNGKTGSDIVASKDFQQPLGIFEFEVPQVLCRPVGNVNDLLPIGCQNPKIRSVFRS